MKEDMVTIEHPNQVLDLLRSQDTSGYETKIKLYREATIRSLTGALQITNDDRHRIILCDVLGRRKAKRSVSYLLTLINDQNSKVRSAAAEALAKIGDSRAGLPLLQRFIIEQELPSKRMQAGALGAIHFEPALPSLMTALTDNDSSLRASAAWAIGEIGDVKAIGRLQSLLEVEQDLYVHEQLKQAITKLTIQHT